MTKRSNIFNLIDTLARDEAALRDQIFLAPLLRGGKARLRLSDLVYEFVVTNVQPGWWVCRVQDARHAELVDEALPWQRGDYLRLWPALRLVLLEALPDGAWLALPYNLADAAQRFGMDSLVVVQLCEGGQPFERVIGRVEGSTVWYDDIDHRADPATAEALRAALAAEHDQPGVRGLGAGEQAAYALLTTHRAADRAEQAATHTEGQLRHALELGGARLLGYEVVDDRLRVTWERDGQRSVTMVGNDFGVIAAGVCLSGDEQRFDLASIVGVVRDAPAFARWEDESIF